MATGNIAVMVDCHPEWQPISTAPRDGTRVLLYASPYGAGSGHWSHRQELSEGYFPVEGHWKLHFCLNKDAHPTHWMPLPASPDFDPADYPGLADG